MYVNQDTSVFYQSVFTVRHATIVFVFSFLFFSIIRLITKKTSRTNTDRCIASPSRKPQYTVSSTRVLIGKPVLRPLSEFERVSLQEMDIAVNSESAAMFYPSLLLKENNRLITALSKYRVTKRSNSCVAVCGTDSIIYGLFSQSGSSQRQAVGS